MGASSRALEPASPLDLFRAGRLRECIAALQNDTSPSSVARRIRAYIRLRQYRDALSLVCELPDDDDSDRALSCAFRIHCNSALGEWTAVRRDEQIVSTLRPSQEIRGELAYARASSAFQRGDAIGMEQAIMTAVPDVSVELQHGLLHMRAWAASLRRDYVKHARLLERVVAVVGNSDVSLTANCAQALAHLAREIYTSGTYELVTDLVERIPWTPDLAEVRFLTMRALAWAHALRGSHRAAQRMMLEVRDLVPTQNWVAASYADQAYLARMARADVIADSLLQHAIEVARRTTWNGTTEERVALLNLIELAADADRPAAIELVALYRGIREPLSTTSALRHDSRLTAMEDYAIGAALASNQDPEGEPRLRSAFGEFSSIRYAWRSAAAALRLHAITNEAAWLERANEAVRDFPESAVARDLRRRTAGSDDPRYAALTATQRRVFALLCRGCSDASIAKEMSISVNTAKNHVAAIRVRFGADSRAQVIAMAREAGLTA